MPDLGIAIPPPPSEIPGLRRFLTCDPVDTLLRASSTPTLALYGTLELRKIGLPLQTLRTASCHR